MVRGGGGRYHNMSSRRKRSRGRISPREGVGGGTAPARRRSDDGEVSPAGPRAAPHHGASVGPENGRQEAVAPCPWWP
jgi:hypothetical protein